MFGVGLGGQSRVVLTPTSLLRGGACGWLVCSGGPASRPRGKPENVASNAPRER